MGEATGKVGGDTAPTQHQPGNVPSLQQAGALLGKLHEHEAVHGLGTTLRSGASEVCVPREDVLQVLLPLHCTHNHATANRDAMHSASACNTQPNVPPAGFLAPAVPQAGAAYWQTTGRGAGCARWLSRACAEVPRQRRTWAS